MKVGASNFPDQRLTAPFRPLPTPAPESPMACDAPDDEPEVRKWPGWARVLILLGVIAGGGVFWWGLYSLILAGLQRWLG